jgi:hypothetical protein
MFSNEQIIKLGKKIIQTEINGVIALKVSTTSIQIQSPTGEGVLRIRSKSVPTGAVAIPKENNYYEIVIEKNKSYSIGYAAL